MLCLCLLWRAPTSRCFKDSSSSGIVDILFLARSKNLDPDWAQLYINFATYSPALPCFIFLSRASCSIFVGSASTRSAASLVFITTNKQ